MVLPKPEKTKKSPKSEQLNLVETIDSAKKIKRKRFWLVTALLLTIGSSLVFWLYYTLTRLAVTKELPHFSSSAPSPAFDQITTRLIALDQNSWSIYLKSTNPPIVWSKNFPSPTDQEVNTMVKNLRSTPAKADGLVGRLLPSGAVVHEINDLASDHVQATSLITVPGQELLLVIKVAGSSDLDSSQNRLSQLAQTLYWALMANSN